MIRYLTHWKLYALPWMFLALACGRAGDAQTQQKTAELKQKAGFPGKVLLDALQDVDLRDDQRADVVALMEDTRKRLAPLRLERAKLLRDAAAAVRAGGVDETAIRSRVKTLKAAFDQAKPGLIQNLNKLHGLLDEDQRRQLVDALHERIKTRMHGHGPGAHGGPHKFLKRLAAKLGLTGRQEDNIRARLKEEFPHHPAEARKRHQKIRDEMRAAAEAFVADGFDAAKLALWSHHERQEQHLDKIIGVSKVVLPVLSIEQREHIATHLEQRASELEK